MNLHKLINSTKYKNTPLTSLLVLKEICAIQGVRITPCTTLKQICEILSITFSFQGDEDIFINISSLSNYPVFDSEVLECVEKEIRSYKNEIYNWLINQAKNRGYLEVTNISHGFGE